MKIHLITIGDEILLGKVINTHESYIGAKLADNGMELEQQSTIKDDAAVMRQFITRALNEADILILTGGLGPTGDDNTKSVLAKIFKKKIHRDVKILNDLRKRYTRKISTLVQTQADVPEETIIMPNKVGTAPGFIFEGEKGIAVALPGPPIELKPMFEESVLPYLIKKRGTKEIFIARTYRTIGIRESEVEMKIAKPLAKIKGIILGLCARPYQVDVRISSTGKARREVNSLLDKGEKIIQQKVGDFIYTTDDRGIEAVVGDILRKKQLTLAVAESCTGGLIGSRITDIPGSSDYFLGGIIAYSNEVKIDILGVPKKIIKKYGAVSSQTAKAMAQGVRKVTGASIGISATGIAGPGGGTKKKPVGLVFLGITDNRGTKALKFQMPGTRELIKRRTSEAALFILWQRLKIANR
jgi:nicotinamide-nucleotide amidase